MGADLPFSWVDAWWELGNLVPDLSMDFLLIIVVWLVPLVMGIFLQRTLLNDCSLKNARFGVFALIRAAITGLMIMPTLVGGGHGAVPTSMIGGLVLVLFIGQGYTDVGLHWAGLRVFTDAGQFFVIFVPCYVGFAISLTRSWLNFSK